MRQLELPLTLQDCIPTAKPFKYFTKVQSERAMSSVSPSSPYLQPLQQAFAFFDLGNSAIPKHQSLVLQQAVVKISGAGDSVQEVHTCMCPHHGHGVL